MLMHLKQLMHDFLDKTQTTHQTGIAILMEELEQMQFICTVVIRI